jgi:hypothetical protein
VEFYARPNLSRNTLEVCARLWNRYVPRLGDYGLRELTPSVISRGYSGLQSGSASIRSVRCFTAGSHSL